MSGSSLVGAWQLVTMHAETADGRTSYPYGEEPVGMLSYTESGHMSAVLMRRDRPVLDADPAGSTTASPRDEGFNAYCGTYHLDPARGAVIHHVEASHHPDWVGTDQVRYFELEGDTLRIWTDPVPSSGDDWVRHLTWRRRRRAG